MAFYHLFLKRIHATYTGPGNVPRVPRCNEKTMLSRRSGKQTPVLSNSVEQSLRDHGHGMGPPAHEIEIGRWMWDIQRPKSKNIINREERTAAQIRNRTRTRHDVTTDCHRLDQALPPAGPPGFFVTAAIHVI
jgi:hypothetical protein